MELPSLPDQLDQFVQNQIATGKYGSAEEVLCAALRLLRDRDRRLDELRRDVQVGLDQLQRGEFTDYSEDSLKSFLEEVKAEGRRSLEAEGDGE